MKLKHTQSSGTTTLTMRVPVGLRRRLEKLAKSRSGNRSRLAVEALERFLEDEELQLEKIDQGIRDADAGRTVSHAEVKRYLQSWGTKRNLPPPVCK